MASNDPAPALLATQHNTASVFSPVDASKAEIEATKNSIDEIIVALSAAPTAVRTKSNDITFHPGGYAEAGAGAGAAKAVLAYLSVTETASEVPAAEVLASFDSGVVLEPVSVFDAGRITKKVLPARSVAELRAAFAELAGYYEYWALYPPPAEAAALSILRVFLANFRAIAGALKRALAEVRGPPSQRAAVAAELGKANAALGRALAAGGSLGAFEAHLAALAAQAARVPELEARLAAYGRGLQPS